MRPSSLVISLLLFLFLFLFPLGSTGIRLEKEFMQLGHQKTQKEKSSLIDNDAGNEVINTVCKEGEGDCSKGTTTMTMMRERVSRSVLHVHVHVHVHALSKKSSSHKQQKLPSIHEDYYGPTHHRPKHH